MTIGIKELESALLEAEKAGDIGAAKAIVSDMTRLMQRENPDLGRPDPVRIGQEGMPGAVKSVVMEASKPAQVFAGMGSAPVVGGQALMQLAGMNNPATQQNWGAVKSATPYALGGNIAGNVGMFSALPSRVLPMVGAGLGKMGHSLPAWLGGRAAMVADTIATSGVANYMLEPGEFGDRAKAALIGMGASAVTPATYALGAGARRVMTSGGRRVDVGERLSRELGDDAVEKLSGALRQADPNANLGVLTSSAQKTGNPVLQVMESGSRAKRSDLWQNIDNLNADARWGALQKQAGTPEELAAMKAAREAKTGSLREEALGMANQSLPFAKSGDLTPPMVKPLTDKINDFRTGKFRPNQDVQTLADFVSKELEKGVTPDQLYEIRKSLTDGIKTGRNDQLANAAKAARSQRVELVGLIDDALNDLTAGGWKEYMGKYAGESLPISSKQALQDIVGSLKKGMPVGVTPPALGQSSAWKTLGILRDRYGLKDFGSKTFDRLTPEDRGLLEQVIQSVKTQADVMKAQGVLGSHTGALIANANRSDAVTRNLLESGINRAVPFGGMLASRLFDSVGKKAEEELAVLLQNPELLAAALASAKTAKRVGALSSKAGAATGGALAD